MEPWWLILRAEQSHTVTNGVMVQAKTPVSPTALLARIVLSLLMPMAVLKRHLQLLTNPFQ